MPLSEVEAKTRAAKLWTLYVVRHGWPQKGGDIQPLLDEIAAELIDASKVRVRTVERQPFNFDDDDF